MSQGGLFPGHKATGNWWHDHSLSIVLGVLLTVQTLYAIWSGHMVWMMDAQTHGDPHKGWPSDFWLWWSWEYNISIVADTYGVLLIVILTKWLNEINSDEGGAS